MFWNLMVIAILHAVNTGDTAESLKISRETTRFTAPLVQGRLDYFAAIDDLYRKPPRENAFAAPAAEDVNRAERIRKDGQLLLVRSRLLEGVVDTTRPHVRLGQGALNQ